MRTFEYTQIGFAFLEVFMLGIATPNIQIYMVKAVDPTIYKVAMALQTGISIFGFWFVSSKERLNVVKR